MGLVGREISEKFYSRKKIRESFLDLIKKLIISKKIGQDFQLEIPILNRNIQSHFT